MLQTKERALNEMKSVWCLQAVSRLEAASRQIFFLSGSWSFKTKRHTVDCLPLPEVL